MSDDVRSAYSSNADTAVAAVDLCRQLAGNAPQVIVFFHSPNHDGRTIAAALHARFPRSKVIGGSTCGEFSDQAHGRGGVTALALGAEKVEQAASAMFSVEGDLQENVRRAMAELSSQLGGDVRELDPTKYVGIILVDSSRMREELVNEALGNACPLLSFVGGSVGDNMKFEQTLVHDAQQTHAGHAVVLLMRLKGPFHVLKACNYAPTEKLFTVTRADPSRRMVLELDGRPAAEVYAGAIGAAPDKLDMETVLFHPFGLMIEGKPWLRSVIRGEGNKLIFACSVQEGMQLSLMRNLDIVEDTRRALLDANAKLGKPADAGLMFNCVARMVEVQVKQLEGPYYQVFKNFPVAGFHAHGESWLGHMNQTLTGLLFA